MDYILLSLKSKLSNSGPRHLHPSTQRQLFKVNIKVQGPSPIPISNVKTQKRPQLLSDCLAWPLFVELPVPSRTHHVPIMYPSRTHHVPVPYLSLICSLPVPYLSLTCPLSVHYPSLTCLASLGLIKVQGQTLHLIQPPTHH